MNLLWGNAGIFHRGMSTGSHWRSAYALTLLPCKRIKLRISERSYSRKLGLHDSSLASRSLDEKVDRR